MRGLSTKDFEPALAEFFGSEVFQFIDTEKTSFPIAFMCARLGVSTAGYYAWLKRPPSARSIADAELAATIQQNHARSRDTYGVPRIHAELGEDHGVHCGRKRVARLMRPVRLQPQPRRAIRACLEPQSPPALCHSSRGCSRKP